MYRTMLLGYHLHLDEHPRRSTKIRPTLLRSRHTRSLALYSPPHSNGVQRHASNCLRVELPARAVLVHEGTFPSCGAPPPLLLTFSLDRCLLPLLLQQPLYKPYLHSPNRRPYVPPSPPYLPTNRSGRNGRNDNLRLPHL
jgi:hypothetical protein